ncbi:MAG: helix-turn-helix domain-containing protein [Desulfomonile tiedjei]|uniref:Helix-turn-helix domain-containing protein n=1 Tax=Desulfomonile tiedjei TaxID=2358 RepID=A0A9D6Z1N4_9BACT|nr:helix-turn-helix domain-containing protein [Desulfomonile tiedjei]
MGIRPIHTEEDYRAALARLENIWDAEPSTPESDELDVLALLVEAYEEEHYPIDPPDPIDAIKFRMEQIGLTRRDLEQCIGSRARVSEVLSRKRRLSLDMIRKLNEKLGIPAEILIAEYPLRSEKTPPDNNQEVR